MTSLGSEKCDPETCDIFDFMARHVGMTVVHPGGFEATRRLAESCKIGEGTRVIDIACGKGTSAVYLAEGFGCNVVGIDIAEDLVSQAKALARQRGLDGRISFRVGDALDLPFKDGEFDVAVSQAMLVLVGDKERSVKEALRVVKLDGHLGWLELSWKKEPTQEFMDAVSNVLCAYCMRNVHTFEGWEKLLTQSGVRQLTHQAFSLQGGGFRNMVGNEGTANTLRIMLKYLANGKTRKRMKTMNKFFREHTDMFGYGIFTGRR
jgi:ubiquinone/menaquinone biosynthesis C-methylase UbiE